jgi:hypothetical protein
VCPNAFFVVFETWNDSTVRINATELSILYNIALTVLDC